MIFLLNLEKSVFKLMQNLMSKLQFNGFLFSGKVVSSCSWWRSHHCPCLLLWTPYLFCLIFSVYLSQGLHAPFICLCLALLWLFLDESSRIVLDTLWCVQWSNDSQLPFILSCWCLIQCVNSFFVDSSIYLRLHEQVNWYPGWLLGSSFGLFWQRMLCKFLSVVKVMSLFTFFVFSLTFGPISTSRKVPWVPNIGTNNNKNLIR